MLVKGYKAAFGTEKTREEMKLVDPTLNIRGATAFIQKIHLHPSANCLGDPKDSTNDE